MTSLNTSFDLPDIYVKNSLSNHFISENLIKHISNKIRAIPNYHLLKNEIELCKLICNMIENMIIKNNKGEKIDKQKIVVDIFSSIFSLNEQEITDLKVLINFLHNNKLIKKISTYKYFKKYVYDFAMYIVKKT